VAGEAGGLPQLQVRRDLRQARPDHGRRALLQRGGQQPVQPIPSSPRQAAHIPGNQVLLLKGMYHEMNILS
jgi:hypothetical protein